MDGLFYPSTFAHAQKRGATAEGTISMLMMIGSRIDYFFFCVFFFFSMFPFSLLV